MCIKKTILFSLIISLSSGQTHSSSFNDYTDPFYYDFTGNPMFDDSFEDSMLFTEEFSPEPLFNTPFTLQEEADQELIVLLRGNADIEIIQGLTQIQERALNNQIPFHLIEPNNNAISNLLSMMEVNIFNETLHQNIMNCLDFLWDHATKAPPFNNTQIDSFNYLSSLFAFKSSDYNHLLENMENFRQSPYYGDHTHNIFYQRALETLSSAETITHHINLPSEQRINDIHIDVIDVSFNIDSSLGERCLSMKAGEIALLRELSLLKNDNHGNMVASVISQYAPESLMKLYGYRADSIINPYTTHESLFVNYIEDSIRNGVCFINCSSGVEFGVGCLHSMLAQEALLKAKAAGIVIFQSMGNDSNNKIKLISSASESAFIKKMNGHLICVTACNDSILSDKTEYEIADFSTLPGDLDTATFTITAPGVAVPGRGNIDQPLTLDGTSFSAPIVTGIAASLRSSFPLLRPIEIARALLETATPQGSIDFGRGVINPNAAYQMCQELIAEINSRNDLIKDSLEKRSPISQRPLEDL